MDAIRSYLIRITVAALICGVIGNLIEKKGSIGITIRMMCGVFMTFTLLSPLVNVRLTALPELISGYDLEADVMVVQGKEYAKNTMADIIRARTEAYILDEAESMGADIAVEVKLNEEDVPIPCKVRISGNISPYGKERLKQIIKEELGIPVEEQIWVD